MHCSNREQLWNGSEEYLGHWNICLLKECLHSRCSKWLKNTGIKRISTSNGPLCNWKGYQGLNHCHCHCLFEYCCSCSWHSMLLITSITVVMDFVSWFLLDSVSFGSFRLARAGPLFHNRTKQSNFQTTEQLLSNRNMLISSLSDHHFHHFQLHCLSNLQFY